MSSPLICHPSPKGGIDDRIAQMLNNGYTKEDISALRDLYDMDNANPLINPAEEEAFIKAGMKKMTTLPDEWRDKLIDAQEKLMKYKKDQTAIHKAQITESSTHMAKSFGQLYGIKGWNGVTRRNRINMIVSDFVAEVTRIQHKLASEGIFLTREEIVNGHKVNGEYQYGQLSIFETIFNKYFNIYKENRGLKSKGFSFEDVKAKLLEQQKVLDDQARSERYNLTKENPLEARTYEEQLAEKLERNRIDTADAIDAAEKSLHLAEEYSKVLANWAALCTFARMQLREVEGLKLGNTLEYASPATIDNFTAEDYLLANEYDVEESWREAWQTHVIEMSAFASMGAEVRRFLSTITEVDVDGNKVKDDLGYFVKMDPVQTHTMLAEALRGVTSESRLVKKLKELSKKNSKYDAIFKALAREVFQPTVTNRSKIALDKAIEEATEKLSEGLTDSSRAKNPVLLTQFLVDLHKNFVPFTALIRHKGKIVSILLNRRENPLEDEFDLRMALSKVLSNTPSVYDESGNINWKNLGKWYFEFNGMFSEEERKEDDKQEAELGVFSVLKRFGNSKTGFWSKNVTDKQRTYYLTNASRALGIPMTEKDASLILADVNKRNDYIKALRSFAEQSLKANPDIANSVLYLANTGVRPSGEAGVKYDEHLNSLKESDVNYEVFRGRKYGHGNENSPGLGNEAIYRMLNILADVTENLKTERRVSFFDRKGKAAPRFSDLTPSYMGDLVDKIHEFVAEGDGAGLKRFIEEKWGASSYFAYDRTPGNYKFYNKLIQEIYDSIEINSKGNPIIRKDALAKTFMFDQFLGSNIDKRVTIFENFSEKQHGELMLKQFIQYLDASKGKSPLAKYPCFILGDSGVQRFFTSKRYTKDTILKYLKEVAQQEIEHRKYVRATNNIFKKFFADTYGYSYKVNKDASGVESVEVFNTDGEAMSEDQMRKLGYRPIENYSKTENDFTTLTFLNTSFEDGRYWQMLTGKTAEEMRSMSPEKAMDIAIDALHTDALEKTIKAYMDDAVLTFKEKLVRTGTLKKIEEKDKPTIYVENGREHTFAANLRDIKEYKGNIENLIEDFYWNTKYATIQQLQLFTVDPAFYDYRYPIKDLQKRYKEIYAPGKTLSLEARDYDGMLYSMMEVTENGVTKRVQKTFENVIYFDDIAVSAEEYNKSFMSLIERLFSDRKDIISAYKKNTLTDGQAYRTLESYRAVRGMAGEWTRYMEEAYKRIQEIRKKDGILTDADLREMAELATVFQPIKPYLYTLEKIKINDKNNDEALVPVQHKYAEIVLIPELMQEGKLKDMARWMEANHIDMAASTKCVKVGAFGSTMLKGANTTESINNALSKAYVHKLSYEDYRIQSGVPEHLNQAQLFGTQIRKLILSNISKGKSYDYLNKIFKYNSSDPNALTVNIPGMGNVHLTGANLINFYNSLIMANMFDSYEELTDELSSVDKISTKLIQNVISNASQSEDNAYGFSLIEEGLGAGEFLVPLCEPNSEHDSFALLSSLFRKAVNKQKILGGSVVQASAMGISGYEDAGNLFEVVSPEGDNVLYDEIEMPWNRSYTSATGKTVYLKFEDWCYTNAVDDEFGHHEIGDLKLSNEIVYGDEAREYLSWPVSGRDKFGKPLGEVDEKGYDKQGYYKPLIETKYEGILNTIAYRIPTEREYSMLNCKVFRFSHPEAGGVIKVPASRTSTAGFDFDIDKLYFFMREFAQTYLTDSQKDIIWKEIYNSSELYRSFSKELKRARAIAENGGNTLGNNSDLKALAAKMGVDQKNGRDFHYWENVLVNDVEGKFDELPRTAEEAFTKYLEDHRDGYPTFDVYDLSASPLNPVKNSKGDVITPGNTKAARNNMLFDLMRSRLMDKETLKARYTPGGFENNRAAALKMRVLQYGLPEVKIGGETIKIVRDGKISWADVDKYVNNILKGELKDPEPEYDPSDPTAILVYNQQNQIASKLIGIFANQNTNHVYASTLHKLALTKPIRFGNHTSFGLADLINHPDDVDVDTNMAEYLAASVDAVKDPVLNFLNLNLVTADAASLLARIGYTPEEIGLLFNQPVIKDLCTYVANTGATTDRAILEMLKSYGGNNATFERFSVDYTKLTTDRLADNIMEGRFSMDRDGKLSDNFKKEQLHVLWLFKDIMASSSDLNSFVQSTRFTAANSIGSTWGDMIAQEFRVKNFTDRYVKAYERRRKAAANSDSETSGSRESSKDPRIVFEFFDPAAFVGSPLNVDQANMDFLYSTQGIVDTNENLLSMTPNSYVSLMSRNPFAFEQCMMDLTRKFTHNMLKKYYPYHSKMYTDMRSIAAKLTKYGTLDADTINSLHREFMVYMLSELKGSKFDGEAERETIPGYIMSNRTYYTKQFPIILEALKYEGVLDNIPFFQDLQFKYDKKDKSLSIGINGVEGLQSSRASALTQAWADAYLLDHQVHSIYLNADFNIKDLAEDLYYYNFYHLGYNFHPTSFIHLTPTILKLGLRVPDRVSDNIGDEMSYIDFINNVLKSDEEGGVKHNAGQLALFVKQYILNHLDNNKFVFNVTNSNSSVNSVQEKILGLAYDSVNGSWNDSFTISRSALGADTHQLFLLKDEYADSNDMLAYVPVIALDRTVEQDGQKITQKIYYMANSSNETFNYVNKADGSMTYSQVYPQGSKGKSLQYFTREEYSAFQRTNKLKEYAILTPQSIAKENVNTNDDANSDTGNPYDSSAEQVDPSLTTVKYGGNLREMFSEQGLEKIADGIRQAIPMFANYSSDDIISFLSTTDSNVLERINEITKKFERGDLKTIDKDKKEIPVCG